MDGRSEKRATGVEAGLDVGLDLSLAGILARRIRMPSPLPLVDTHPLAEWLFPVRPPPSVGYRVARRRYRRSRPPRGSHVVRFVRRAGADRSTPDGEYNPRATAVLLPGRSR